MATKTLLQLRYSLEGGDLYTKEMGRYVLDVTKINDDYLYTLKDTQNNKETQFSVESEINLNVGISNAFNVQKKLHEIQDKASFDEAIEAIKLLLYYIESPPLGGLGEV